MKRSIAFVLALVMVLTVMPTAAAKSVDAGLKLSRGADPVALESAKILEQVQPYGLTQPTDGEWLTYIIPDFRMYGMTVVQGEIMELCAIVGDADHYDHLVGVLLYEGYYEDLADDAEPLATVVVEPNDDRNAPVSAYWDTTGFDTGDYTVVFCLVDEEGTVIDACMCDVFVSEEEIPLEGLGLYVLELGREATTIYEAAFDGVSIVPILYPYHTTERDDRVFYRGHAWTGYGASHFPYGEGITPNGSDITAYIMRNGAIKFETVLKVIQPEENNRMYFERLSDVYACHGEEIAYRLHLPYGASMDEVLFQISLPGRAAIRVEGDIVYVRNLTKRSGYTYLTAAWGDYYTLDLFLDEEHLFEELTTITAPTATRDGLATAYCSNCGQYLEVTVSRIFADTEPGTYYADALEYCYTNGIINGLKADTFGPFALLDRAQLVTMLYRLAGSPAVEGENSFTDVADGQFYTDAVIWASANGIVNGYEDGTFRPGTAINREQLVTMIHRYVAALGEDNGQRSDLAAFTDLAQLSSFAREPMQWAVANGVVNGVSSTKLGAQQTADRAQTVTILYRIITGILEAGENG